MPSPSSTRRAALAALAGLGASACSLSPTLDLLGSAFSRRDAPHLPWQEQPYPMTAAEVESLPYATLGLRWGSGAPIVMVLAEYDGPNLRWASADRVIFVTREGWLTQTAGLPRDLAQTQWRGDDPLPDLARKAKGWAAPTRSWRSIDVRDPEEFGVGIESRFAVLGPETIEILGRRRATVCVQERASVPRWRWQADNRFWLDPDTGTVWRSRQQFCPDLPPMLFETLKPAAAPPRA